MAGPVPAIHVFLAALSFVMPGLKREARLRAYVPGIHVFLAALSFVMPGLRPGHPRLGDGAWIKTWMAGTGPAMTSSEAFKTENTKIPASAQIGALLPRAPYRAAVAISSILRERREFVNIQATSRIIRGKPRQNAV
jgi:hypothetical protein